jgi:hypothetical protein
LTTPISVNTAFGQKVMATHRGMSKLFFQRGTEVVIIPIYDVLYSKELKLNLLTDKSTTDTGASVVSVTRVPSPRAAGPPCPPKLHLAKQNQAKLFTAIS